MAPYQGYTTAVGFGEESTWGTAVARTIWRPAVSASITRAIQRPPRSDLFADSGAAMRKGHFDQSDTVEGTIRILCTYDNVGMLLKHAIGTLGTTGTGAPYTHTYTLAATLPTGLTIELVRGKSTNSEVFEGCKISRLVLEVAAGQEMMLEMDFVGQTSAARSSAGTPSFGSTDSAVLHHHAGQMTFNSVSYDLTTYRLEVNNNLTTRFLLGSTNTAVPVRGGFMDITVSVGIEAVDTLYAVMTAGTASDLVQAFTSGADSFTITLQNAYNPGDWRDAISDAGIVQASGTFVGESDGTDLGVAIVVLNSDSTGIGN